MEPSERPEALPPRSWPVGRAAFLGAAAAGVGLVAAAPLLRATGGGVAGVLDAVPGVAPALDAVAPRDGWRIYAVDPPFPRFDAATYALRIDGLVERPLTLAWREVASLPGRTQVSDFHCVTGWSVADVRWEGIAPRTLVDLVRPLPAADHVTMASLEEPYVDALTLEQFLLPDVLVARRMDGAPLSRPHGAPLRVVIPRMYGYKGVKWLGRLTFAAERRTGYWEARGYDADAWIGRSNGHGG